jgi:mRNA interferase MazF
LAVTRRGDLVTVPLQGDFGKPRPVLIVQTDLLNGLLTVMVCPLSSELRDADFRVLVQPTPGNGLRLPSQVMVDKLSPLPRSKISAAFGRLEPDSLREVDRALLLVMGLA